MYTVRIEHSKEERSVYPAHKYRVGRERERVFILIDETGSNAIKRLLLEPEAVAYVMNGEGVTVDKIKGKAE